MGVMKYDEITYYHLCPVLWVGLAAIGGVAPGGGSKLLLEETLHVHLGQCLVGYWHMVMVISLSSGWFVL